MTPDMAASPQASGEEPTGETESWILRCAEDGTLKRYEDGGWSGDSQWMSAAEESVAATLLAAGRVVLDGQPDAGWPWPYRMVLAAPPEASATSVDPVGKTVRWANHPHYPNQWFTARVTGPNTWGGFEGECVDPGNWRDRDGFGWSAGEFIPNMRAEFMTVIDSEPDTEDLECE